MVVSVQYMYQIPVLLQYVIHTLVSIVQYLYAAGQHGVQDVRAVLHDADVAGGGVGTLAVLDGVDEAVPELLQRAQQVLLYEADHAVVCGDTRWSTPTGGSTGLVWGLRTVLDM